MCCCCPGKTPSPSVPKPESLKYKGCASFSRVNTADLLFLGCWSEGKADSRQGSAGPHTSASITAVLQQAAGAELLWDLELQPSPCLSCLCNPILQAFSKHKSVGCKTHLVMVLSGSSQLTPGAQWQTLL